MADRELAENPYAPPRTSSDSTDALKTSRKPIRRWSLPLTCILVNFAAFHLGVFFNEFGGTIDQMGAAICSTTFAIAFFLIPASFANSILRVDLRPARKHNFLDPLIATLALVAMCLEALAFI